MDVLLKRKAEAGRFDRLSCLLSPPHQHLGLGDLTRLTRVVDMASDSCKVSLLHVRSLNPEVTGVVGGGGGSSHFPSGDQTFQVKLLRSTSG